MEERKCLSITKMKRDICRPEDKIVNGGQIRRIIDLIQIFKLSRSVLDCLVDTKYLMNNLELKSFKSFIFEKIYVRNYSGEELEEYGKTFIVALVMDNGNIY